MLFSSKGRHLKAQLRLSPPILLSSVEFIALSSPAICRAYLRASHVRIAVALLLNHLDGAIIFRDVVPVGGRDVQQTRTAPSLTCPKVARLWLGGIWSNLGVPLRYGIQ